MHLKTALIGLVMCAVSLLMRRIGTDYLSEIWLVNRENILMIFLCGVIFGIGCGLLFNVFKIFDGD